MKKILFIAAAALLTCGTVSAQFSNTTSNSSAGARSTASVKTDGYGKFYFQYNPSVLKPEHGDNQSFNGLALGFSRGLSLSQTLPFYLEVGGNLQFSFWKQENGGYDDYGYGVEYYNKFKMLSINVPVLLTYEFMVSDKVGIAPYTGLRFRLGLWGSSKMGVDYNGDDYYYDDDDDDDFKAVNIFDKKKMGSYAVCKRFQAAWEIGLNIHLSDKYYIGGGYAIDFNEFSKKTKIGTGVITAGLMF